MKKVTIKDIAREAGVSTATVSMIVNHKDQAISEATRVRVLGVVQKHHFIPNGMAGSLVTKKTKTIGLILPDIVNPYFPEIARGAEDRASKAGFSVILCNTDDKADQEEKYMEMLAKKMVDGIIFAHSANSDGFSDLFQTSKVPVILIDRDWEASNIKGRILVDNAQGSYLAVRHLLGQGCRRVVYLSGSLKTQTAKERLEGYRRAILESGLQTPDSLIRTGEYKTEWGMEAVRQLLSEAEPFDALFCGNDLIAIGAIKELREHGLRVPQDVSVVGFDDISIAGLMDPPLTTIRQPKYEMGYQAVDLLLKALDQPDLTEQKIILKTELIIRASSLKELRR